MAKKRKKKNRLLLPLICVAVVLIAACAAWLLLDRGTVVTVNGIDMTDGTKQAIGQGTAQYDAGSGVLRLENVCLEDVSEKNLVYANIALTIDVDGYCLFGGKANGIYVKGDLSITGNGSLRVYGGNNGIYCKGTISFPEKVSCVMNGGERAWKADGLSVVPLAILTDADNIEITTSDRSEYVMITPPVTLTYKTVGGSAIDKVAYRYNTAPGEYAQTVREGFIFKGWYTARDYETEADPAQPMTQDAAVYALWEKEADEVLTGIDVSSHQEAIEWANATEWDVDFAIVRAGFRGYGETASLNRDAYFEQNIAGAKEMGLKVGAYFYTQATTEEEAREEARFVLEILDGVQLDLPVFYDLEYAEDANGHVGRLYNAQLTQEELYGLCCAFCDEIESAGYEAMVYANCTFLSNGVGKMLEESGRGVWLAHYAEHTYYEMDYDLWQYSSKGTLPGIEGYVDMNRCYVVYKGGVKPATTEVPQETAQPAATEEPQETAQPAATEEPRETASPTVTAQPAVTAQPGATAQPDPVPGSIATKLPERTAVPEGEKSVG